MTGGVNGYEWRVKMEIEESHFMLPPDEPQPIDKMKIVKAQFIAVAMMFVLLFVVGLPTMLIFNDNPAKAMRIIIPIMGSPWLFIGFSSIIYKTSMLGARDAKHPTTGQKAILVGIGIIIFYFVQIVLVFSPIFDLMTSNR